MNTDQHYMHLALEEGKKAKLSGEWPFGAVIVCGDEVVAQNHCTESAAKNVLAHAELQAVGDACKALGRNKLDDCVIYCTNEPCLMCASAIIQAKIPKVIIGACRIDMPHLLRERKLKIEDLADDAGYPIEIVKGVMKGEVVQLFSDIQK